MKAIRWDWAEGGDPVLHLLDQRKLPHECVTLVCRTSDEVAEAIRAMAVRGAPAIAATAAYGIAMAAHHLANRRAPERSGDDDSFAEALRAVIRRMEKTRPTAVNLFWATRRMLEKAEALMPEGPQAVAAGLIAEAEAIADEDVSANRAIGRFGAELVPDGAAILTHCNTGSLATVDYGTALGVIRAAHEMGKGVRVYAGETRPFLQGARLTAWELQQEGIPVTLIADGAAGYVMARGLVDLVVVGADRVAANGDVVNKIGTYPLAVLARTHGIPFYVAAPTTTVDLDTPTGADVPIEERDHREVTHVAGTPVAPIGVPAFNPAFDVTPAEYVTAIITERGVVRPPYAEALTGLLARTAKGGDAR